MNIGVASEGAEEHLPRGLILHGCMQGVKKSAKKNLAHMYQSLAVLAGEMGFVDEARAWFRQGTATVRVRCLPASARFL